MIKEMRLKANAKINLGLDVLRRREDGYHDLRMIMQTVTLHDVLELTLTKAEGIRVRTNLGFLPVNEDNLVYKAAALLLKEFPVSCGVFIDLKKHIPVAAGLAGGSADAAAVLTGLNRMLELGLSREELMERGVKIGADVPYCILKGTALAEGIGEKLTVLPAMPACSILLVKPPVHVSTKYVYTHLHVEELTEHPDIDAQVEALGRGDLGALAAKMGNVLETVTVSAHPVIAQIREQLCSLGARNAMMSGSGPTVFGIFDDAAAAADAFGRLRSDGANQVILTEVYNP